jgi:Zn-dependent peptidase ImmA (M78 family)
MGPHQGVKMIEISFNKKSRYRNYQNDEKDKVMHLNRSLKKEAGRPFKISVE